MNAIIQWLEGVFNAMPISLLEGWGRFGYVVGLLLMIAAYGGFTFRLGGRWGLGRERQHWDTKALLCIVFTFVLIISTGYLGSFIVLVPGAQTFESLKDLSVFLCVILFGYPALLAVPFAYGISDLAEGVPPDFLWNWMLGYFINPACFWIAFQLIGKNPDFRQARTWGRYAFFVVIFMCIEPQLWGYICSEKFTSEISYRNITPALFFTTSITWIIAPFAMLLALPLAKKAGLFWADIPGHVRERPLGQKHWVWQSGQSKTMRDHYVSEQGLPIRIFLAAPLVAFVLVLVVAVAFLTMRSGENGANKLASRLHQEVSLNIDLQLDDYLEKASGSDDAQRMLRVSNLLKNVSVAKNGRVFLIDRLGALVASSAGNDASDYAQGLFAVGNKDIIVDNAIRNLVQKVGDLRNFNAEQQFRFDVVTAKPLSRETWLAQATPYRDRNGKIDWIAVTAMPESAYLGEVRVGNTHSAVVLAIALTLSLLLAVLIAGVMAAPLRRISRSAQALAAGDLTQRAVSSRLEEVEVLAKCFNDMAEQLQQTLKNLETEVEEQKRMKDALRYLSDRLQLATHAANIGIWEWNIVTSELIWDDAMYRLYGIRKEDFGGAYDAWTRSLHPEDKEHATEEIQAVLAGKRELDSEFRIVWPRDGSIHIIKVMAQTLRDTDDKPKRMIGINIDITESRRAEEELRQHRDHLEELVAERTRELIIARDQAETANRSKSAFLSNMSHEIRTPLNAIMGMTYLALANESNQKQRNYLQKVDNAAHGLLGIINDILDFSKIEAGKLNFELSPFSLDEVISHLLDLTLAKAHEKGLEVLVDIEPMTPSALLGDKLRLGQILLNLFSNAVKFTERGEIFLGIRCVERNFNEALLQFEVKDTGIGMTSEQSKRLFTPFEQADVSTTRRFGGTGLGLSISKKLVEMMGGNISVEAKLGVGSQFIFTVRMALQDEQPKKHLPSMLDVKKLRVLVIDDNPRACDIMLSILSSLKLNAHAVDSLSDGIASLETAQSKDQPYDLIMIDWEMPFMNGVDVVRAIRTHISISHTIIFIMAAAHNREELIAQTKELKVDGVLEKPVNASGVIDAIMMAMSRPDVQLPRRQERQDQLSDIAAQLAGAHVLLVEDNDINQELAAEILNGIGVIVDVASNGQEAIAMVHRKKYDAVLMDCQMPIMDGYTATQEIRKDPFFSSLPILAMSANAMTGDREKCIEAGMNDHIAKPIDVATLFKMLLEWIGSREIGKELNSRIKNETEKVAEVIAPSKNKSQEYSLLKGSVLLVEDNLINQEIAIAMLQNLGLQPEVANNGAEAIDMISRTRFDVILMDCQMPVMDGFETTIAIREEERTNGIHVPIIALTANAVADDREMCISVGMDDYLEKPFTLPQLFKILEYWLNTDKNNVM